MYIRDQVHTKGHTQEVTDGMFSPSDKNKWITSSLDGTIRIWDITSKPYGISQNLCQEHVVKLKGNTMRVRCHCCCYSPNSSLIAGGAEDGSIQIWDNKSYFHTPHYYIKGAHAHQLTSLLFFNDSRKLLSRSFDHTMKLWDVRQTKTPIHVWGGLPNFQEKTGIALSPDEKYVITGTSCKNKEGVGYLSIFETESKKHITNTPISAYSVIRVLWHPVLNQ